MNGATYDIKITDREFRKLADVIFKQFGIRLNDNKKNLVEGRLQKILKQKGFATFSQYYDYLMTHPTDSKQSLSDLADKISTNHTFFWREPKHFEIFENKILPELAKRNKDTKMLRIWCAAASTGEEPYTLAMILKRFFGNEYSMWDAGILATDISSKALAQMNAGVYSNDRVQELPVGLRNIGFDKVDRNTWKIKPEIKGDVTIRRFNLMNPLPFKSQFDVVFCRNVMIYFDDPTREDLVNKIFNKTKLGGHLFVSLSESLNRSKTPFTYSTPGHYKKG